jgi:hypothetical protein
MMDSPADGLTSKAICPHYNLSLLPSLLTMSSIFNSDDTKLIEKFVQGSNQLLSNDRVRLETNAGVSQVVSRTGEVMAIMYLQNQPRTALVKSNCSYGERLNRHLVNKDFVLIGESKRSGYLEYHQYVTPAGYQVHYTEPALLWKKWWPTERFQNKQRFNMNILVRVKDNWYPVQDISIHAGTFTIKTLSGHLEASGNQHILWLSQRPVETKANDTQDATDAWEREVPIDKLPTPAPLTESPSRGTAFSGAAAPPAPPSLHQTVMDLEARLYKQQRATIAAEQRAIKAEQQAALGEQKIAALQKQIHSLLRQADPVR